MKNIIKFLGIITLVAAIGFSMFSCGDDEEEGTKGLTITGLNNHNGEFAAAFAVPDTSGGFEYAIIAAAKVNINKLILTCGEISGGSVFLYVWKADSQAKLVEYAGNDKMNFYVVIWNEENINAEPFMGIIEDSEDNKNDILNAVSDNLAGIGTLTVNFKKGAASGNFEELILPLNFSLY